MKIITSLQNQLIKELKKHQSSHMRKKTKSLVFVEGKRACEPFLSSKNFEMYALLCTPEQVSWADEQGIADDLIIQTTPEIIQALSQATTPSGLIGVFKPIKNNQNNNLKAALVLAEIQDPGNMGTLIRTATALGAACIIVDGVSPYNPKVVQSTAGTLAHAAIQEMNWDELCEYAAQKEANLIALVPTGGEALPAFHLKEKKTQLLVVGNEAHGIRPEWIAQCSHQITIPILQETESLNAAIAGAIALYQITSKANT